MNEQFPQFQPSNENMDRKLRNPKGLSMEEHEDDELVNQNKPNQFIPIENIPDESVAFNEVEGDGSENTDEIENEYRGPKAHEYKDISPEEIAARYPEYSTEYDLNTTPSTDPHGEPEVMHSIKNTKDQKATLDLGKKIEGLRSLQSKDNMKTISDNEKTRQTREKIRDFLHTTPITPREAQELEDFMDDEEKAA